MPDKEERRRTYQKAEDNAGHTESPPTTNWVLPLLQRSAILQAQLDFNPVFRAFPELESSSTEDCAAEATAVPRHAQAEAAGLRTPRRRAILRISL
jgi:hypothetical protein